jgi:endonuclease G
VLFKLVFDPDANRARAWWQENANDTRGSRPISYAELVLRTGIDFLPGARPDE